MSPTLLLRRILALDAASCFAVALPMCLAAPAFAPLFGLAPSLLLGAGLLLLPLGGFIAWLASRPAPPRPLVWIVIVGNLGWTAESLLLIAQREGRITPLGTAFVAAQGLAVLALALIEYAALRRLKAVAA